MAKWTPLRFRPSVLVKKSFGAVAPPHRTTASNSRRSFAAG